MVGMVHGCSLGLLEGWLGMVPVEMEGVSFGLGDREEHRRAPVEIKGCVMSYLCRSLHNCSQGATGPLVSNPRVI